MLRTLSTDPDRGDRGAAWRRTPVMLMTLESTPFERAALDLAICAAVDRAAALIAVNVVQPPIGRGPHTDLGDPPHVVGDMRDALARGSAAGLEVQCLRVCAPRTSEAVVEIVQAHAPALVVIAPDLERRSVLRLSRRRYRRALRALATRTDFLLWSPEAAPPPALLSLADRALLAGFGRGRDAWGYGLPPLRFIRP
jgi:hypothetical protein